MRRPIPTSIPGGGSIVEGWLQEWAADRAALEAAEAKLAEAERMVEYQKDVIRRSVSREAVEAKLAEAERVFTDAESLAATVLDKRVAAAEGRIEALEKALGEIGAYTRTGRWASAADALTMIARMADAAGRKP